MDTPISTDFESAERVPTVPRPQRRRFSLSEKRQMVEESLQANQSVSMVARRHDVNANQLFKWRRQYLDGALDCQVAGLLPIQVDVPPPATRREPSAGLEIELDQGRRITVHGNASAKLLRIALEVLAR